LKDINTDVTYKKRYVTSCYNALRFSKKMMPYDVHFAGPKRSWVNAMIY